MRGQIMEEVVLCLKKFELMWEYVGFSSQKYHTKQKSQL